MYVKKITHATDCKKILDTQTEKPIEHGINFIKN